MRNIVGFLILYSNILYAKPTDLGLVWNLTPSPHGDYAYCEKAKAGTDFCLQHGQWLGYCADGPKKLKWGHMRIENGKVNFSACKKYRFLLAAAVVKKYGFTDKAALSSGSCSTEEGYMSAVGNRLFCARVENNKELRFASQNYPKSIPQEKFCDMADQLCKSGKSFPLPDITDFGQSDAWDVYEVEDLDGDGLPEVLLSRAGITEQAVWISPKNPSKVIAQTITKFSLHLGDPEGKEVESVLNAQEDCQHFSDEEPYNAERKKEIEEGSKKACAEFNAKLKAARGKYPKNKKLKALRPT